jgi:hypothetical protein
MENFIGFCDTAVNDAATGTITSPGYVTTTQASLTPGQQYYVQFDGTLALTADSTMVANTLLVGKVLAGTALTANNLYVDTSSEEDHVPASTGGTFSGRVTHGSVTDNPATLLSDITAPASYSTAIIGPVTVPNLIVNGNLTVMTELDVTGNTTIASAGQLNIIG